MKTAILLLITMTMTACGVQSPPVESSADQPVTSPGQCEYLDCANDIQCSIACGNFDASCVIYDSGDGAHGFCLNWTATP